MPYCRCRQPAFDHQCILFDIQLIHRCDPEAFLYLFFPVIELRFPVSSFFCQRLQNHFLQHAVHHHLIMQIKQLKHPRIHNPQYHRNNKCSLHRVTSIPHVTIHSSHFLLIPLINFNNNRYESVICCQSIVKYPNSKNGRNGILVFLFLRRNATRKTATANA